MRKTDSCRLGASSMESLFCEKWKVAGITILVLLVISVCPIIQPIRADLPHHDFMEGDLIISYVEWNDTLMTHTDPKIVHYDSAGNYISTIISPYDTNWDYRTCCFKGMAFDWTGNLFACEIYNNLGTSLGRITVLSGPDSPHTMIDKYEIPPPEYTPMSIVFDRHWSPILKEPRWNFYVGCKDKREDPGPWGFGRILKFNSAGDFLEAYDAEIESPPFVAGANRIDLNQTDQQTMFYTCGGAKVRRYNISDNTQLPDFATLPGPIHAGDVRILPEGGAIVTQPTCVYRLDVDGTVIQTYDVEDECEWSRLALDVDGTSFYAGSSHSCGDGTGKVYKFDLDSGVLLDTIDLDPIGSVGGLVVYQEYNFTAPDPVLTFDELGGFRWVGHVPSIVGTKALGIRNIQSYEISYGSPITVTGQLQDSTQEGQLLLKVETETEILHYGITIYPHSRADYWPMFRHDLSHMGCSTSTAPRTSRRRWNYTTMDPVELSPVVAYGKVFFGSGYHMYALNETTGGLIWSQPVFPYSSPAVAGGLVFFGSNTGLYALNETDGTVVWGGYAPGQGSSPAVSDGKVLYGSGFRVYALNVTDGSSVWNYTMDNIASSSPAVANDLVFIGSNTKLYALNLTTGNLVWQHARAVLSSPAVAGGLVFFGSNTGLYALNETDGTVVWGAYTGSSVYSSPAVNEGKVYFGCDNHKVYALNATDKSLVWIYTTGGVVRSSPAVADDLVFAGSGDGIVYAINETNGQLIWRYTTGGEVHSSPAIAYGNLFVGSADGNVYGFGPNYDVAVSVVQPCKIVVGQNYSMDINVTVQNLGGVTETFYVDVHYNGLIGTLPITLPPLASTTITVHWDTTDVDKGNYTISAYACPVLGETNTADNTLFADTEVFVTIQGDVDGDRDVDIYDVVKITGIYNSKSGDPQFNPNSDLDNDGEIKIYDVVRCTSHYGQSWQP